jgi:hypothetical protein
MWLALPAQGFWPLGNRQDVARPVPGRWNLAGHWRAADPRGSPGPGACARAVHGHSGFPERGIGAVKGRARGDGNKRVKGIKRHILTCSLGFVLAAVVTAANVNTVQLSLV